MSHSDDARKVLAAFRQRPTLFLRESEISARALMPVSRVRAGLDELLLAGVLTAEADDRGYGKYRRVPPNPQIGTAADE